MRAATPFQFQRPDIPMESLQKAAFAYLTYVWHEAYCRAESGSSVQRDFRDCFVMCFYDIAALDAHLQLHFNHLCGIQFSHLRSLLHHAWFKAKKQKATLRPFRRGARRARARDASDTGGDGGSLPSYVVPVPAVQGGAPDPVAAIDNMRSRMEGIITSMEEIIRLMQNLTSSVSTYRM